MGMMDEFIIDNLLKRAGEVIEQFENTEPDKGAKEFLRKKLETVRDELVDLQNRSILELMEKHQTPDSLPKEENLKQKNMTEMIMKINELTGDEKW